MDPNSSAELGAVPEMDQNLRPKWIAPLVFALCYFACGVVLLPVLQDWVSLAVDEGWIHYGAQRLNQGELPHRDFFFLWTPGILLVQASIMKLGGGWLTERGLSLFFAALTVFGLNLWAVRLKFSKNEILWMFFLHLAWGFSLWNFPYSSWYAIALAIWAAYFLERSIVLAGLLFGISFWFKQNIGLLALAGGMGAILVQKNISISCKLFASAAIWIALPFGIALYIDSHLFKAAFQQIFLFPFSYRTLMYAPFPWKDIGGPMIVLGFWILGLIYFQKNTKPSRNSRFLVVTFVGYLFYVYLQKGNDIFLGSFFFLSLLVWPLSFLLFFKERDYSVLYFLLPCLGAFFQAYPRSDFQHFLFTFPIVIFLLIRICGWIGTYNVNISKPWVFFPLGLLLWGGIILNIPLWNLRLNVERDETGRLSSGAARLLNKEMADVKLYLETKGMKVGDPLLVAPNATFFYSYSQFRNPTPHNQFFPGYVQGYGANEGGVLGDYIEKGGRFIVIQQRSGFESNTPVIYHDMLEKFHLAKNFPLHFSVWERNP